MPKTFFCASLGDQTFTRSTASRAYTHMVAVRSSYSFALRRASGVEARKCHLDNGRYYLLQLEGKTWNPADRGSSRSIVTIREYLEWFRRPYTGRAGRPVTDEEVEAEITTSRARALEALDGALTAEAYAEAQIAASVAKVEAQKADGHFDRFGDGGWASRLDLAQKNAGQLAAKPYYEEVRILEAAEVSAATFRALTKKGAK